MYRALCTYLQRTTNKFTMHLMYNSIFKNTTCFDSSMHHFQIVLLLYQSYVIFETPILQSYSCFKIIYAQQAIIINS